MEKMNMNTKEGASMIITKDYINEVFIDGLLKKPEIRPGVPPEVAKHVKENLTTPTDESSICVDGGYTKEQARGELARPGADLGLSVALLALGFSPQDAFSAVYNFRVSRGQKYGWHSDTHVDSDGSVDEDSNPNMRFINLHREHVEEGILVVESKEATVYPWDENTGKQFFVYDAARDAILIEDLFNYISEIDEYKKYDFNLEELNTTVQKHTNATLKLLKTSRGAPMYTINVENGKLILDKAGVAPVLTEDEARALEDRATSAEPHHSICGCGHCAKANEESNFYEVDADGVAQIVAFAREKQVEKN